MRVAIATDWFEPRLGGIESQLRQLADGLSARGHDVAVVTTTPGPPLPAPFRVRRIAVRTLPGTGVAIAPALVAELRQALTGFDVVHAHASVVSPVGYAAAAVARAAGTPTVLTFHSVLHGTRAALAVANALFRLDRSGVVWTAVSELVAAQVRRALPRAHVAVLPNGLHLAFWRARPVAPPARGPGSDLPRTLVTAMRLHRKKRPAALLRAFAAASRHGSGARLVVAGSGPQRDALERQAARLFGHGSGAVTFMPWLDADALRRLYARADAFVLPSRHESFGLAALEARAAGLPVIAMRQAGCVEFLRDGENALLCDDDRGLRVAIGRVMEDHDLRRRLAATDVGLERYDWRAVLSAHEAAYAAAGVRTLPA